ncbi:hypothetical protein J6590_029492 [Homalodisca vitripennis]|nr:hypothetical protein J6590_029492 [Homalodisca vitripennis]
MPRLHPPGIQKRNCATLLSDRSSSAKFHGSNLILVHIEMPSNSAVKAVTEDSSHNHCGSQNLIPHICFSVVVVFGLTSVLVVGYFRATGQRFLPLDIPPSPSPLAPSVIFTASTTLLFLTVENTEIARPIYQIASRVYGSYGFLLAETIVYFKYL